MDATYNVNSYSFHLISVLVLDQYQEGIPVAWGISNREDEAVIKYIFEAIKSTCGDLSTEWFMSTLTLLKIWEQGDSTRGGQLKIGYYVICVYYVLGLARISERGVPFHLRKIKLIVPIQLECTT